MQTIKLEIDDAKVEVVLNIIHSLKDDIIRKYEIVEEKEEKVFQKLSEPVLKEIWDNREDSIYDRYLNV